jgi:hypothetical protein
MMVVPRSPAQSTAIETAGRTFLDAYRRLNIVSIRTPKLESWTPKLESWTPPKLEWELNYMILVFKPLKSSVDV